jgi:3-oxoacyl-(acyl-carrier-protein) synthase
MNSFQVPAIRNLSQNWSCQSSLKGEKLKEPAFNGLNYIVENVKKENINVIVKNALSFGGINMSAVFKKY